MNIIKTFQELLALFLLAAFIYLILLIRKWWNNDCVKCGRKFWDWNLLGRRACFVCREKIDKEA